MAVLKRCDLLALFFMAYFTDARASNHSIRLSDGGSLSKGYVQVNVSGVWKDICSDGWDALDAMVTCRQLGFTEDYALLFKSSEFHYFTPVPYDRTVYGGTNFACNGNEETLLSCKYTKYSSFCTRPAGVACGVTKIKYDEILAKVYSHNHLEFSFPSDGKSEYRVLSESRRSSGNIILTGGVCDMDDHAAMTVCRNQGFINGGKRTKLTTIEGLPMMISKITCRVSDEVRYISYCDHEFTSTGVCPQGIKHNGVHCYTTPAPSVIGALIFPALASLLIVIAAVWGIRWIQKDRKPASDSVDVFVNEYDDDDLARTTP